LTFIRHPAPIIGAFSAAKYSLDSSRYALSGGVRPSLRRG
jgi:hypothetical protein